MLRWVPSDRDSARDLLNDAWFKVSPDDVKQKMSRGYFYEWNRCQGKEVESSSEEASDEEAEEEEDSDSQQDEEEWQSDS